MAKRPSFTEACSTYVHRFTQDHIPNWAHKQREDGTYYAPQYRSDEEWYVNTIFPYEPSHWGPKTHCNSQGATWPLGQALTNPYTKKDRR